MFYLCLCVCSLKKGYTRNISCFMLVSHNKTSKQSLCIYLHFSKFQPDDFTDPYGKKPIENGLGPMTIVEMGGILVFF